MTARFGAYTLDSDRRLVTRDGDTIHLTPKAFDLLRLLVDEAPRVVHKHAIHERLWPGTFVSDATLVGLVKELRRALGDRNSSAPIVRTAHGVGYAFAAALDHAQARQSVVGCWIVRGGHRVALSDGENTIGRDPTAVVFLDVAGVSRRHARIVVDEGGVILEDLGSKNGTRVGGMAVTNRIALRDGDQIQLGPVLVVYHVSASGMSTETIVDPPARGGFE
jgi:DNA-binding winged helix-turn-helix (wHTH) protein